MRSNPLRPLRRLRAAILLASFALPQAACTSVLYTVGYGIGVPFLYREAELPPEQVQLDVPYQLSLGDAASDKHRLDFFRPAQTERGWPTLIFVHGGGWTSGDRAYEAAGYDIYRNIGRFFAARGVGVAMISYRLQPGASWRDQIDDVRSALVWVHAQARLGRLGADPDAIFLSGHSAGAYLATYVALDSEGLRSVGVPPSSICGIVPVSGAAFDLTDERTWELGASRSYYEERFRDAMSTEHWTAEASPVQFASADAPPALILYAGGEEAELQRQSQVLNEALQAVGAQSRLFEVPGEGHQRMVLTLSRDDKPSAPAVLDFIRERSCGADETHSAG